MVCNAIRRVQGSDRANVVVSLVARRRPLKGIAVGEVAWVTWQDLWRIH